MAESIPGVVEFNLPDDPIGLFQQEVEAISIREREAIDRHYMMLSQESASFVVGKAVEAAHQELAAQTPYATDKFGYEVARDALLWCQYRNAYLQDWINSVAEVRAEGLGAPEDYEELDEEIEWLESQQEASTPLIEAGDSYTYYLFAQLEALRKSRENQGETIPDPLEMEQMFTKTKIMNSLDRLLEEESAIRLISDDGVIETFISRRNQGDASIAANCLVIREEYQNKCNYTLMLFSPDEENAFIGEGAIVETPQGIEADFEELQYRLGLDEFSLAQLLCEGGEDVTQRPASPIKELAGRA